MTDTEILIMDGCTRSEAEKHLQRGTTIFTKSDFLSNFDAYMDEWDIGEEERLEYKAMIEEKKLLTDWGIVESDGEVFFIQYCL